MQKESSRTTRAGTAVTRAEAGRAQEGGEGFYRQGERKLAHRTAVHGGKRAGKEPERYDAGNGRATPDVCTDNSGQARLASRGGGKGGFEPSWPDPPSGYNRRCRRNRRRKAFGEPPLKLCAGLAIG